MPLPAVVFTGRLVPEVAVLIVEVAVLLTSAVAFDVDGWVNSGVVKVAGKQAPSVSPSPSAVFAHSAILNPTRMPLMTAG